MACRRTGRILILNRLILPLRDKGRFSHALSLCLMTYNVGYKLRCQNSFGEIDIPR